MLTRELILETAMHVLSRTGPDGFTMNALAQELGVKTPALYHHVGGKASVLTGMRTLISNRIDTSMFGQMPWHEAVEAWAWSYRAAFAAHPHAIASLATSPMAGAGETLSMYEAVSIGLRDADWPETEIVDVIVGVESLILGAALDAVAPVNIFDPGDYAPEVPVFSHLLQVRGTKSPADGDLSHADRAFRLAITALTAGLQVRLKSLQR